MAVTCTFGGLNINDGTNYRLRYSPDFGENIKTYDERRSYKGGVLQYHVTEANLITMSIPLRVYGSSITTLTTNVAALNNLLDNETNQLVYNDGSGSVTYTCLASPRVYAPRDYAYMVLHRADVVLTLIRAPE